MATRGTAGKSASGASMSRYDVEVETRLKALEANAHAKCDGGSSAGGDRLAALEAKVDKLIEVLNSTPMVQEHCPKSADGTRRLPI